MPLVDRAVRTQKVEILLALHIPHVHAFPTVEHDRKGVVIVGTMGVLQGHQIG